MFNQVILMGEIVETPVFPATSDESTRFKVCIEVTRPFKQKGTEEYNADLIDVYVWEGLVPTLSTILKQGSVVVVKGRLEQCDYIDPSSGEKVHSSRVIAERFMLMKSGKEEEE